MKTFQVMFYTLLEYIRDKQAMAMMLLMPIGLIFLLGHALSGAFERSEVRVIDVAFLNEDKGEISDHFETFLANEEIGSLLNITHVDSYEEGKSLIEERSVWALIYIKEDYSKQIIMGEEAKINLLFVQGSTFTQAIVTNIVRAFNNEANKINALTMLGAHEVEHLGRNFIEEEPVVEGGEKPRAMDYYAVTILVMILMYGSMYTSEGIGSLKEQSIGKRLRVSPVKAYQIFAGVTLASIVTVFAQGVILVLFTKHVYGVNWGSSITITLMIVFIMTLLSSSIGMVVGTLIPNMRTAEIVLTTAVPVFTVIAGGYVVLGDLEGILGKLQLISPNYHMQNALFNHIFEGDSVKMVNSIATIIGITILMFTITLIARRRYTDDSI